MLFASLALVAIHSAAAQPLPREFPPGRTRLLEELPAGQLRTQLEGLPAAARDRALAWLNSFHFTTADLNSLRVDPNGGVFYADEFTLEPAGPVVKGDVAEASLPITPFPAHLVFHSRPGAPNVLFLNFSGETISNSEWNNYVERPEIPALAFSSDADHSTFSDAEQAAIKRIWQRVAEDFAPFNIDVTTERPATFNNRTAHALITRNTDANGAANPASASGGVAYVNVFGTTSYARYRPAWIYYNNLGNSESYIAEAASHEVGHNLGLSHDGTSNKEYYGGHGSGDISWGPIMGTGYNRNVSQWSKGEYYQANNTQDDLATIAGKLSYRTDDHGNTPGTATPLIPTGGTNIVSTTPETDPDNAEPTNKGVFERATDVDVFSFVTGSGEIRLEVNPWIMPSGTRGGNLDVSLALYNEAGALLLTNNPASQTVAAIQTGLPEGRYYLHVKNSSAGTPLSSTPTGYTAYGSLGQYFINGYLVAATDFVAPPVAELQISDITQAGQGAKEFTVTYSDDVAVDVATIDSSDIRVTGPNGYDVSAQFVSLNAPGDGTPRVATYSVMPPSGDVWLPSDHGTYTVQLQTNAVSDTQGAVVAGGTLGSFNVSVPVAIYTANMNVNPGWTLEPDWEYGTPSYSGAGPTSGFTGSNIIAYNLNGNYTDRLSAKYATTPPINCAGASSVTLRFRRWLRTRPNDTATIQVSIAGSSWINVWSSSGAVSDNAWQEVQYPLPAGVAGSPNVRLRWGLSSNPAQNEIGWNLDDVELLGDGMLDTTPPVPSLGVADLTQAGSPSHACSVTYSDSTAVRLASLDSNDLAVTGPNGYSNVVEFIGADLPDDGSPLTGTYSIPAPGGSWEVGDNGTYTLTLLDSAVEDTANNTTPQVVLGSFTVAISTATPGVLTVSSENDLRSTGTSGGPFSPSSFTYTLTNSGGTALEWIATSSVAWLGLLADTGLLEPGTSTNVTAYLTDDAQGLLSGDHVALVGFTNVTTGAGNTNSEVRLAVTSTPTFKLTVSVNEPAWGSVNPDGGTFDAGAIIELTAIAANYFRFVAWSGDAEGTNNPLTLLLDEPKSIGATFAEVLTTNYSTPYWWLAAHGYTNDFENAVESIGANGIPVWQSWIAGLDPNEPSNQLRLTITAERAPLQTILQWHTVTGRVYSILHSTHATGAFLVLPGAADLPADVKSITNDTVAPSSFFRLEVRKP